MIAAPHVAKSVTLRVTIAKFVLDGRGSNLAVGSGDRKRPSSSPLW